MGNEVQVRFTNPNREYFGRNIMYASALGYPCIDKDRHKGQRAVIVGSGPSLNNAEVELELLDMYEDPDTVFFGCKAAIRWLAEHDMTPEYGVSIDPGAHIACDEKIARIPGVTHLMASVTAPEVFDYLKNEDIEIFHSVCGLHTEIDLYDTLFEDASIMQGGFNVVNRALAITQFMGFDTFIMAGCDSGWRDDQPIYADGRAFMKDQKKVFMNDDGLIDGTSWHSTPDMVASAVALAMTAKAFDKHGDEGKFVFLGDGLPKSLRGRTDDFLREVADTGHTKQEKAA
jgi:hypothetical protein